LVQADAIAGQAFSPAGQAGRGEERSPVGLFHGKQRLQKLDNAQDKQLMLPCGLVPQEAEIAKAKQSINLHISCPPAGLSRRRQRLKG
ncbi:MAG: hypothetical protein WAX69_06995, partial [Victivallales bacterium]